MTKKEISKMPIKHLIILCHIVKKDVNFLFYLSNFLYNNNNSKKTIQDLQKISTGKKVLGNRKIKEFYESNKDIIDIINKYSSIPMFVNYNFNSNGLINSDLDSFFDYFLKNKEHIDKILDVLNKIRSWNYFDVIYFNENLDFTKDEYHIYRDIDYRDEICFLDNLEPTPNVDENSDDVINYRSSGSNYKIIVSGLSVRPARFNNSLLGTKKIILNSLVFDSDRLPNKISFEDIVKPIRDTEKDSEIVATDDVLNNIYSILRENSSNKEFLEGVLASLEDYSVQGEQEIKKNI